MGEVQELSYGECRALLAANVFGRLALCTPTGPQVLPVNYSVVGESIVLRTSAYGVVAAHDWSSPIAFEVDFVDRADQRGWSVVAVGRGARVEDVDELAMIKRTWDPQPWAGGSRPLYVRLAWTGLTGRRLGPGRSRQHDTPARRRT